MAVRRDRKAGFTFAANKRLRYFGMLLDFAKEARPLTQNPAFGIKRVNAPKGRYHVWTFEEVRAFETHYAVGTPALFSRCR